MKNKSLSYSSTFRYAVLLLFALGLSFTTQAQSWNEVIKIAASDRARDDYFGSSVSISGDYAIVGAYGEDEDAAGGNTLRDAGSAYILKRDAAGNWAEIKKLVASDRRFDDFFGYSVSISGDYAIVGAWAENEDVAGINTRSEAGSAYIFQKDEGGINNWGEVTKIVASDRTSYDRFGYSVSISGDYAIVGAYQNDSGSAYIFQKDEGGINNWGQVAKIVASDRAAHDRFGHSVSISEDYAIVGAYGEDEDATGGSFVNAAGSAYIFQKDEGGINNWGQVAKIVASNRAFADFFGGSVSISGDYAIVGAGLQGGGVGSVYLFETPADINVVFGYAYLDNTPDCTYDSLSSDTTLTQIMVKASKDSLTNIYTYTNNKGEYRLLLDTGDWHISVVDPNNQYRLLRQPCPDSSGYHVTLTGGDTLRDQNFAFVADRLCAALEVDVTSNRRRRCRESVTTVTYQNVGYVDAPNAQIQVIYPQFTDPVSSVPAWDSRNGDTLTYTLGTLVAQASGRIVIQDSVDCNNPNVRGLAQCTKAIITPANLCVIPDPTWSGASIEVSTDCKGGLMYFTIKNTGSGDVVAPLNYYVYTNAQLIDQQTFQLDAGQEITFTVDAQGQTIYVEAEQAPGHPNANVPSAVQEGCPIYYTRGLNTLNNPDTMTVSTGFVTAFPPDDANEEVDISCMVITDSYDPNDKQASPQGILAQHYIEDDQELEYTIRFQNTGNAPAIDIFIEDTLDANALDVTTFEQLAASHAYELSLNALGDGNIALKWTFLNINLPDSINDEPNSHGFVKFRIAQQPNNPIGTRILNEAAIYFDFNPPIITNQTFHEIADLPFPNPNTNIIIWPSTGRIIVLEKSGAINNDGVICQGTSVSLTTDISATSYAWDTDENGVFDDAAGTSFTFSPTTSTQVCLQATTGAEVVTECVTLTVIPWSELSISVSPSRTQEDDDLITIVYTFTAAPPAGCGDITVNFSVSGTAIFNDDYYLVSGAETFTATSGTVIIPAGQSSAQVVLQAQQDAISESDETIILTIENP